MSTFSIFLVEDHAGFAKALLNMLSQDPSLKVEAVADSAESALKYLRGTRTDLVLIDYSLPDINGITLLEQLRYEHPEIPCAILSGHLSLQHACRSDSPPARA